VSPIDKPPVWLHGQVKSPSFSKEARLEAGFLLRRLQKGENVGMPHSRPTPSIAARCHELRVVDAAATWRIVYRIDLDAIVIAEVFSKKSRATPQSVVDVCRRRLRSTTMRDDKRKRLEAKGWKVGSARDFLGLSSEEDAYIKLKLKLADAVRERRRRRHVTQVDLARVLRSSQSRVAKIEAGHPSVSLDLLIRSLLALGVSERDLATIIGHPTPTT
jgi:phage-related protein/DNA-binding XRE family transcriptional regulator